MNPLPVDDILPQIIDGLRNNPAIVVQAPPGAGKTTRVPLALLKALPRGQKILMLEPRRLAATNAARWMAATLGEEVGQTVGYTIRFDRKVSAATRIEVVTEGILNRRLQVDPQLPGFGIVIFDEFHERSLHSDLALALCRDAQLALRPDLKLLVMSATLDAAPVAALLGAAPLFTTEGRSFPVEIRYHPQEKQGRIAETTSAAICQALGETRGDILAFLPGAGEIHRCLGLLQQASPTLTQHIDIYPLYGDLPFDKQERAILPGHNRKVVLATNIAETSLTIEGVQVVIDSGWCRELRFDPGTGLNRLFTNRISAASATQRAGRAGRTAPGICYRLWTEHVQSTLLPFNTPEICASDLCSLALDLALWGVHDPSALSWLDLPPTAALAEGRELLKALGALDHKGFITEVGRKLALLPLHPRLAHLVTEGQRVGHGALACDIAALLTERDVFAAASSRAIQSTDSDMLDRIEFLAAWRRGRVHGNDPNGKLSGYRTVDRLSKQLQQLAGKDTAPKPRTAEAVGLLLTMAYPDRIGRQREPGSRRYLLVNGRGGTLSPRSNVANAPFIVAVVMEGGEKGDGLIHSASAVDSGTIRREFREKIRWWRVVTWDERQQRVIAREEERLDALVFGARPIQPSADEVTKALLEGIGNGAGLAALGWTSKAEQFRLRVCFLASIFPEMDLPDLSEKNLLLTLQQWLGPHVAGVKTIGQLGTLDILPPLRNLLRHDQLRFVEEQAPTHISVPSGSMIPVEYVQGQPPVLAVKLQEMFGLADTPKVAGGRVAVTLHLLSPARRPIQVTQDLRSFWNSTYAEVKKELRGRYPRHPWPDDPWNAAPTRKTKARS